MIDYELAFCYGIIVSDETIMEIAEVLTDEEYDELRDNYVRPLNSWTNGDYFVGTINDLAQTEDDLVYKVSNLTAPADNDENLISFIHFFNEHDLWKFIDWKPELLIIDFCY